MQDEGISAERVQTMLNSAVPGVSRCVAVTRVLGQRLYRQIAAFHGDRAGNVTMIFALCAIPLFGAVAVAVDYSRANAARTAMQAALDATTLMISKEALDLQSAQVQTKARSYFNSLVRRPDVKSVLVSFAVQSNGPGDFTVVSQGTG